jgi:hypothetical protein
MKPPLCCLCGDDRDPDAGLVQFADFEELPEGRPGHPRGLEWFCSRHLEAARAASHLPSAVALERLRARRRWTLWPRR